MPVSVIAASAGVLDAPAVLAVLAVLGAPAVLVTTLVTAGDGSEPESAPMSSRTLRVALVALGLALFLEGLARLLGGRLLW
jgi:predicted phage tail protein